MGISLRPYQRNCIDAVTEYLYEQPGHPVFCLPTAAGKTIIFSAMFKEWMASWPTTRVCILAHRQELLEQTEKKFLGAPGKPGVWPGAPISVYSAGLRRRETDQAILIAGIQSVYRRAAELPPFDVVLIDECHLVPFEDSAMYRRFLQDVQIRNPKVRFIGCTATDYRLDGGPIAGHEKALFSDVCFQANIQELIRDGYLCNLVSRSTKNKMDTKGIRKRGFDFSQKDLEDRFNENIIVEAAVEELMHLAADRNSILAFACGVDHAYNIAKAIEANGREAKVVVGDTPKDERAEIIERFDGGDLPFVVNVNCLTTGLDVTRVDCISLLRPTESTSLVVQMCGRGFRLHEGKKDCLVLDFAGNVSKHGPIDCIQKPKAKGDTFIKAKECPECETLNSVFEKLCTECGHDFTEGKDTKECPTCAMVCRADASRCGNCGHAFGLPREPKHDIKAGTAPVLNVPVRLSVFDVTISRHEKKGKPDSLKIIYFCNEPDDGSPAKPVGNLFGITTARRVTEWVCLEHEGPARMMALKWWLRRFPKTRPPYRIDQVEAWGFTGMGDAINELTKEIVVMKDGKFDRIRRAYLSNDKGTAWEK